MAATKKSTASTSPRAARPAAPAAPRPDDLHELVSFRDPDEDRTWVFDVTFLTSPWQCIFGNGCKGVYLEDATHLQEGCCSHGAHLIDKADRKNLEAHAARLTDDQWQFARKGRKNGITEKNDEGVHVTRLVDGACIFLNRPGFPGGAGCALHRAAMEAGESFVPWKPEVCWQLPLRREDETDDYGHITSTIREWKRRDWSDVGEDFHWWCTDSSDAFTGKKPVWESMEEELTTMVGTKVYAMLAAHLRERRASRASGQVFLPHPALRKR